MRRAGSIAAVLVAALAITAQAVTAHAAASELQAGGGSAAPATRAEAWRRLREDKAQRLHPYVPKGAEKFAIRFEDELLPRLLTPRTGFYPFIGRITSGAGFALGPGYRRLG